MQTNTYINRFTQPQGLNTKQKRANTICQAICHRISDNAQEQLLDIKRHAALMIAKDRDIDADLLCPFARVAMRAHAFPLAIELAEYVAEQHRDHESLAESYFIRAQAQYSLGEYQRAYKLCAYLLVKYPDFEDIDAVTDCYENIIEQLARKTPEK